MGSSRATVSPTFFSHLVSVPSVMDSPICGMRTSVPGPEASGAGGGTACILAAVLTAAGVTVSLLRRRFIYCRGRWGSRCRARVVDGANDGSDADRSAFLHLDFAERAGRGRGNLSVDFVGGDLEERFIASDGVAGLLEPLGERAFGDGFAHLGHNDVDWHGEGSPEEVTAQLTAQFQIIRVWIMSRAQISRYMYRLVAELDQAVDGWAPNSWSRDSAAMICRWKTRPKFARDAVGGLGEGRRRSARRFQFQRRYRPVGDAAGDDPVEVAQVGGDVQGEAVRGDALGDVDADGGDLLLANAAARQCPDAGEFADALGRDAEVAAGADEGLFHQADEVDGTEVRATFAGKVAAQVEDGVADELAGAVVGDVAAAVDLVELDAAAGEQFVGGEDVGAGGVAAEGENGRMLEQKERVADGAGLARGDDLGLDAQAFGVGDAAELEEMDMHT